MCNRKLFFIFLSQNTCCGYSKELSQWDSSFEHSKHMFLNGWIRKITTIAYAQKFGLPKVIRTYVYKWIFQTIWYTVMGHNYSPPCDVAVNVFTDFLQKLLLQNYRSYNHENSIQRKAIWFTLVKLGRVPLDDATYLDLVVSAFEFSLYRPI